MCNLKTQHNRIMCSFNITVIQIYAPTPNAEEDEGDWFQEDLQHLLELTHTHKDILFIIGNWNVKVRSQETPGVTCKFDFGVQNEARQRLIEFCQEGTLVIVNIHGQFQNQIDFIL